MTCATTLPSARALVYTAPVLKSMVHSNTVPVEVAAPTFKRGFVTSKFWGLVRLRHPFMVSGGMGLPARMAARLQACLKHPVHLLRVQTQTVAFFGSPVGIQTMHPATQGRTTPTPATSATHHHTTEERRAFAALEAANCAALARWYSARGNVKAARRKAVQLLAALAVFSFHHDSSTELRWTTPKPDAAGLSIT